MPIPEVTTDHVVGGGTGIISGAVIIQLIKWARGKRQSRAAATKSDAESAATIAGAWETLLQPLRDEVKRLSLAHEECEARGTRQRADIEELKNQVATLTARINHPPA